MKTPDLFVWQPSRSSKFTRIEYPAFDDEAEEVDVIDGVSLDVQHLNLIKSDKARIPDFLYDVGLSLIISRRAWEVIGSANVPGIESCPATLWDRKDERECARLFLLNPLTSASLLDRRKSKFRASKDGVILREISHFEVDWARVPDEDNRHRTPTTPGHLFLCEDGGMKIFSRHLVEKIKDARLNGAKFRPLQGTTWP